MHDLHRFSVVDLSQVGDLWKSTLPAYKSWQIGGGSHDENPSLSRAGGKNRTWPERGREIGDFIAKQPAPAPHLAHPEGYAALRIVLVGERMRGVHTVDCEVVTAPRIRG